MYVNAKAAIEMLRRRLGDTQKALAERLGTTITTVSRYENGRIQPSEEALRKLASIAGSAGLNDLQDFFENQRRLGIVARVESLPSAGTQRRVSLEELKQWEALPHFIAERLVEAQAIYMDIIGKHPIARADQDRLGGINRVLLGLSHNMLPELSRQIELYISSPKRKEKRSGKTE
jgi:transcriptional regulator with XRE-family HTH domain